MSDIIPPTAELIEAKLSIKIAYYLSLLENIPGGLIISRYIKSSYKNDPLRSLFEFVLFVFAIQYFLSSKKRENKSEFVQFSKQEVDQLIEDWTPEPLIQAVTAKEAWMLKENHVKGPNKAHIELMRRPELGLVLNLSNVDFLDLAHTQRLKDVAAQTISSTGVGACGPPNFYGTQDVHVRLEEDLSRFLGTEQAILYGQDLVTAGSVIPAFLKRGDLAVVDLSVNVALQKALIVSRCDIEWYDHNDMAHLEEVLRELAPILNKQRPLRRRFIITEGLFSYTGDLAKLPELVALKNKYKYRLFLDETWSIGAIGHSGRGLTEHFDIPRSEIAITIGSMATSFASSGGFCVGVRPMVHHQRINSLAYVFSASLPPYSARVVSEAIKVITEKRDEEGRSEIMNSLHAKVHFAYEKLQAAFHESRYFYVASDGTGPIIHLALKPSYRDRMGLPEEYGDLTLLNTGKASRRLNAFSDQYNVESYLLQKIIDVLLKEHRILINRTRLVFEQENLPVQAPRLWFHVNNGVSTRELEAAVGALASTVDKVCQGFDGASSVLQLEQELLRDTA